MAWHTPLLNRTQFSLKPNFTHTRSKNLLGNPENTWTARQPGPEHAVAYEISRVPAVTVHSVIGCSTMPCAAGSLCALKPDHTPGPPHFTNKKYMPCLWRLPSWTLGSVKDPISDNEMHRLCHLCVTSTTRKESGADTAVGAAKRHCLKGARSAMKRVDTTARRKARVADQPQTTDVCTTA